MSREGRNYTRAAYEKGQGARRPTNNRSAYVHGNTVRKIETAAPKRAPEKKSQHIVRKNRDKAHHMSAGYVLFLTIALCAAAYILVNYIELQAELTNRTKSVARKMSQLNNLCIANDEEYSRIINSINLEDIKRIAIGELGMVYAEEGQIIIYENASHDYMREVPADY